MKMTKQELLSVIKAEAGPMIVELIQEQMAKSLERFEQQRQGLDDIVSRIDQQQREKIRPTLQAAKIIHAMASTKGNIDAATALLKRRGEEYLAKALAEGTGSTGGYLISPTTGEFIERLSADAIIRQLGARTVPMPNGSITLPAGDSGATANWVGENSTAGSSQPGARTVTMAAKKLMVVIPVSNELLNDASQYADMWIESEARTAASLAEDLAFIRGAGGSNAPRGMRYRADSNNIFNRTAAAAAATAAEIYADLGKAISKLATNNVPMIRCGWAFSKRTEWHLRTLLNSLNLPMFQEEMSRGMLMGFPFRSTTQIPITLSVVGSGDESEVYFADFYSFVIGEMAGVTIKVVDGAAYYDSSSSAVVSGISNDQTVVVLSQRVDCTSLYQGKDISVINAVDWGA